MKSDILNKIEELEQLIFKGYNLWIFRGYIAINKRGAEKIISEIYSNLPDNINKAHKYLTTKYENLQNSKPSNIYDILKILEKLLDKNCIFSSYSLVDKKEFEAINEQLKEIVSKEISK